MNETKNLLILCLVGIIFIAIFIVQQNYKFRIQWNKIANRYNLIWEEYTINQEYKQKTVRLGKVFNIFRWNFQK
jgi:hypothetical protein